MSDLLARPAQPPAEAIGAARYALRLVDDLQESIEAVLTEATEGLADRVDAASAVFAGMGTDLPITGEQRADLTALEGSLLNPLGVVAAVPDIVAAVAVVRQEVIALTALGRKKEGPHA